MINNFFKDIMKILRIPLIKQYICNIGFIYFDYDGWYYNIHNSGNKKNYEDCEIVIRRSNCRSFESPYIYRSLPKGKRVDETATIYKIIGIVDNLYIIHNGFIRNECSTNVCNGFIMQNYKQTIL